MSAKGQARGSKLLALAIGLLPQAPLVPSAIAQTPASQGTAPQATPGEPSAAKPGIRVAPVILAEPEVETSVNIQVGPDSVIPRQTFLRIRGLPLAAKLSDGHVVSPGVWAVPLAALPTLRLLAPLSSSGRTEVQLSLVGVEGGVLAETKSSLVVAPAWLLGSTGPRQDVTRGVPQGRPEVQAAAPPPPPLAAPIVEARNVPAVVEAPRVAAAPPPPPAAPPVAPQINTPTLTPAPTAPPPQPASRPETQPPVVAALPPATAPVAPPPPAVPPPAARAMPAPAPAAVAPAPKAAPQLTPADRERAETMVQRGDAYWRQGNFAAARQFFRRAADMGLAAGALRMGATYDPVEIASISVVGVGADPKEASMWYERARELGAPEASARLSRLQSR